MKRVLLVSVVLLSMLCACNKDWKFADYKYSSVYFPYQTPVRTLVLGEDIYDNTSDNEHRFTIMATMGGVYENNKDITLDISIDNSLADRLKFNDGNGGQVVAMPANYFTLSKGAKIVIPSGKLMGGLDIQLTDAFFADPKAMTNTFVIPVKINSVTNADTVLRGTSTLASPDRRRSADWTTVPKDYVLYAVKYVNPYHGIYLRRGVEQVKGNNGNTALDTTNVYHKAYVEQDELATVSTRSLTQDSLSLNGKDKGNVNIPFRLYLTFDNNGKIIVSGPTTASYVVSGVGEFVKKGDMWGQEKRDVMHLKYNVDFGTSTHSFTDTLVLRDRNVKFETFNPFITN